MRHAPFNFSPCPASIVMGAGPLLSVNRMASMSSGRLVCWRTHQRRLQHPMIFWHLFLPASLAKTGTKKDLPEGFAFQTALFGVYQQNDQRAFSLVAHRLLTSYSAIRCFYPDGAQCQS